MKIIAFTILLAICSSLLTSTSVEISLEQSNIPVTLRSLLTFANVTKVQLIMKHLTRTAYNTHEGILMHIHSENKLDHRTENQIASVFGVSEKSKFRLWDPFVKVTTIADPNDRLCNEIIEAIFRIFLPCRNWSQSGLKHLVALQQLTQNYLSFNIVWSPIKSQIFLIHEADSRYVRQFQGQTDCGRVSVSTKVTPVQQAIQVRRVSLSKWYHPSKTIAFIINPTQTNFRRVDIITRMQTGFKFVKASVVKGNVNVSSEVQIQPDLAHLVTLSLTFPLPEQVIVHMSVQASLPLFQMFETIGGGGQQFMGLTRLYNDTSRIELGGNALVEYQMMPDFSINFHTITACVAVVLIIWLSLWRNHSLFAEQSILEDTQ